MGANNVKHIGDIAKVNGAEIEPVDVITFGSPCQDLSVAGKRQGLNGERSGLFIEAVRVIKEMRDATNDDMGLSKPRYAVWENVPGSFSSNKGEDFRTVLESLARVRQAEVSIPQPCGGKWTHAGAIIGDGWSIAWRLMDAQYWGVPQRRKRIALVADFGGTTAPEICFERKGVFGNIEESGKEREGTAENAERGIRETGGAISFQERAGKPGGGKGILIQNERTGALSTLNNQRVCCLNDQGGSVMGVSEDVTGALRAQEHGHQPIIFSLQGSMIGREDKNGPQGDGINEDVSFTLNATDRHAVVYGISAYDSNAMKSSNPHSGIYQAETSRTLDLNGGSPACNQGGMAVVYDARGNGDGNTSPTLTGDHQNRITDYTAIAVSWDGSQVAPTHTANNAGGNQRMPDKDNFNAVIQSINDCRKTYQDITGTLDCGIAKGTGNQLANNNMFVANAHIVRRLTPLECERLQGYPDGYTDIPGASDTARYKALGNSIALPQWVFILSNISKHLPTKATLGSLFDGVGGFPLIWQQLHGAGSARWASEIEKFPISVTKYHFGEE